MAKKKILVVDDEQDITSVLKRNLESAGEYEVKTETEGSNVVAAARRFKPDLILLDVMMPDMDGGKVANQIRSDEDVKDTPIVFLTAALTKEEAASQQNIIGGYPFLAKPVSMGELIACIEKNAR